MRGEGTRSHMFTQNTLSLARTCESTEQRCTEYSLALTCSRGDRVERRICESVGPESTLYV